MKSLRLPCAVCIFFSAFLVFAPGANATTLSYTSSTCSGPGGGGPGTGCTSVTAVYGFTSPLPAVGNSILVTGSDINSFSLNWIDGDGLSHPASSPAFNNNGSWLIQNDAVLGLTGSGFLSASATFDVGVFSVFSQLSGAGTGALDDIAASLDLGPVTSTGVWTVVPAAIPVPPALWLFGSGLLGLIGAARAKRRH